MLNRPDSAPVREALLGILDAAMQVGPAQRGNVQVLNLAENALEIAVQRGFEQPFLDRFRFVRREDGCACGRAWRLGRRVNVPSIANDAAFAPFAETAREAGYEAVQSTPIVCGGVTVGVLSTHFERAQQLSLSEGVLVDHYATKAAAVLYDFAGHLLPLIG
jgi:GAF domain-containing protein